MTEYTIDAETDISTVAATDEWTVYQASTGRIKKATALEVATYVANSGASTASTATTASAGAITNNSRFGAITTDTLTTTGQSAYTLTITNSTVTVGDLIMATLDNGTNTTGIAVLPKVHAGAGVMNVTIVNAATTATNPFGGTLVFNYAVFKK